MLRKIFSNIKGKNTSYLKGFLQQRWEAGISGVGINTILGEDTIATTLRSNFPKASFIQVNDVSGGCGAMFEVSVEAPEFKGLSIMKQHRLVTAALSEEIKNMHGIRIQTRVPPDTDNKN